MSAWTIERVTTSLDNQHHHTAIAALMELLNDAVRYRTEAGSVTPVFAELAHAYARLLAPFAPHLAEELWLRLGGAGSVHDQPWPTANVGAQATIELPVQVDGRLHDRIVAAADAPEAALREMALGSSKVRSAIGDRAVRRVVVVPGRVVNVVTQ